MKRLTTTVAFLLCSTGMSFAAINTEAVVADLQAQGYTNIEVKTGPTQVKVEAVRGTEQLEVVYDKETGGILKSETGLAETDDDMSTGVSVDTEDDDFVGDDSDDDSADDNSDDDSGHHSGKGGDDGSDAGDDHGGNSGKGGGDSDGNDD